MVDIPANTSTKAALEGTNDFGVFSGALETPGDHDWIRVELAGGSTYHFYLSFLDTGSAILGNSIITMRNALGGFLDSDDNDGAGLNSFLSFTPASDGIYFIDIGEVGNNSTGEYGLVVMAPGLTDVQLGDANDSDTGAANERIIGGKGSDFINIGFGVDALGEQGNDIIIGNAQTNSISGGIGNDTIDGVAGFDFLYGDAGDDIISASDDGAIMRGGAGNDILDGGASADAIIGGSGKDFSTGGADDDTFIYTAVSDSRRGATRDVIKDFNQFDDRIHLDEIDARKGAGNQDFKFIGGAKFHDKAGELRFTVDTAHNRTIVQGDVNGDGKADFEIEFTGLHVMVAADFIL
jgi:Ca2+-binding RTX toxin-like protein